MSRIYISTETIQKCLKEGVNRQTLNLISSFKKDRIATTPKNTATQHEQYHQNTKKPIKNASTINHETKSKNPITTLSKEAIEVMSLLNIKTPISKKEAKRLLRQIHKSRKKKKIPIGAITERRISKNHNIIQSSFRAFTFSIPNNTLKKYSKKNKPLVDTRNSDTYNFVGEYNARNVEFGHGRRKSAEWNDDKAIELQKTLNSLRQLRKTDPNIFDREAMK